MFKFGKPYNKFRIYPKDNINPEFFAYSGLTMNYVISADPAVPNLDPTVAVMERYATKIVNPNQYGIISHSIRWEDEL